MSKYRPSSDPDFRKGTAWGFWVGEGLDRRFERTSWGGSLGHKALGGKAWRRTDLLLWLPFWESRAGELDKLSDPIMSHLASWQPDHVPGPTLEAFSNITTCHCCAGCLFKLGHRPAHRFQNERESGRNQ